MCYTKDLERLGQALADKLPKLVFAYDPAPQHWLIDGERISDQLYSKFDSRQEWETFLSLTTRYTLTLNWGETWFAFGLD